MVLTKNKKITKNILTLHKTTTFFTFTLKNYFTLSRIQRRVNLRAYKHIKEINHNRLRIESLPI